MSTYSEAGVDLAGAGRHIVRIAESVTSTWSENVVGSFGGFAVGVEMPPGYSRPVLMMTTDGVGTKLELARITGRWSGVGQDLVAMCVDDLAATGARPIGFVDYMAVGGLDPSRDAAIVESVATACASIEVPLLGGETAEHPGVVGGTHVDLAGAALGVVEFGQEVTGANVRPGDVVVGLASPNIRSNGFSLVRRVFAGADLEVELDGRPVADWLLDPSVIYAQAVLAAIETGGVRGCAHITGGGIAENLRRPLPDDCDAAVYPDSWPRPQVFDWIAQRGAIEEHDMRETFNLGVGFALIVAESKTDTILEATSPHAPRVIGRIIEGSGSVRFA